MRGYLRLAGEIKDAATRLKMLEDIRPVATNQQSKRLLLATLAEAADPGALQVAASFLGDADVPAEAEVATLKIARALVRRDPPTVRAAMRKLMDTTKDQQVAAHAAALDEEAMKAPPPDAAQTALQHDKARSDAIKALLAKRAPQGYRLACYLDCGPDSVDGAKGGPLLRLVGASTYFWSGAEQVADVRFGSVFFDGSRVIFEASGLNPKKSYQLGFTWWDFDHATRAQSVILATGKGENEVKVIDKTKLPSGTAKQPPDEKTVAVPADLYPRRLAADQLPQRVPTQRRGQRTVVVGKRSRTIETQPRRRALDRGRSEVLRRKEARLFEKAGLLGPQNSCAGT